MAGVTGPSLVTTIQTEIERARQDLKGVDENLRRLTGRDFNDPNQRPDLRRVRLTSGSRDEEPPAKRRPPGGVFARLGAVVLDQQHPEPRGRPRGDLRNELRGDHRGGDRGDPHNDEPPRGGRRVQEVLDTEEKLPKPSLPSSVARPLPDSKSRSEAAAELTKDRASRDRNRRMFGALLGTLKRFKNDEAKQKDKEEQRAAIERKLEEKGRAEKEELRRERLELFNQRKERQAQIRRLTIKMARVKEHEVWEAHQMKLAKFIRTESTPAIFWVPRQHTARTTGLVRTTHDKITGELEQDRVRMKEELDEILGSRGEEREGAELGEEEEETFVHRGLRSQVAKQGEGGGTDHLDNCPDLLDYEAEEGELVYDEADLSGKDDNNDDTERMVVQVDGRGEGGRKVEIVASQPGEENGEEGRSGGARGNDSEKENEGRCKDRDKDRNKEERHREKESRKSRDKGREKERSKDKEGDAQKGKDRIAGKEERATAKDSHKDSEREKRKERARSKDISEVQDIESDLATTVVHIKIEKEDDVRTSETRPVLKIIKEEKDDASYASGRKGENSENVPASAGASHAVPATGSETDATSTANIELPPPLPSDPALSHTNSSDQLSTSPVTAPPLPCEHSLSPLAMNPSPPAANAKTQSECDKESAGSAEGKISKRDEGSANTGIDISGKGSPENRADKQQNVTSGTTVSDKQTSGKKDSGAKASAKSKLQKDEKKKSNKDKVKKKAGKKKDALGSKRNSGSSDDSSSGSSDSSSDSSESDSSDSDSSSSSSSDSGSSSDSESDSSFSSSSHSDSDSGREKRKRKRGRRSRSEDSSSDSEAEGKAKRKSKMEKSKQLKDGAKTSKGKARDESLSDDGRGKKESGKKDKSKEGKKGKEKEDSHKSKEIEKGKERDLEHRKEREATKKGGSTEKKDKSKDQRRERSRSREDRRGGKKDRR